MKRTWSLAPALLLSCSLLAACAGTRVERPPERAAPPEPPAVATATATTDCPAAPAPSSDRTIEAVILQLNDVYEITPVQGGKWGGLARVATVRRHLLCQNPNTLTIISGDFYSPSALGTAKVDNETLAGKQMVAVLNRLGLNYATFGNHEFDVNENQFYQRLRESDFKYISSNVFDSTGGLFPGAVEHALVKIPGQPGDTLRLGFVGVTLDSNRKNYVTYDTALVKVVKGQVDRLKGRADAIVAITHLAIDQDVQLAAEVPELDLIMGGHEHENIQVLRGADLTPITKADANARSVYLHHLRYDPTQDTLYVDSRIKLINDDIPEDFSTKQVVDYWVQKAFDGFREQGFDPEKEVAVTTDPLDGLESSVRNKPTILTRLIADAMRNAGDKAQLAVFNGGSIRIDDVLPPGPVTEYDVIRVLPFGGTVLTVEVRGSLLERALTQGQKNKGTGGFLQTTGNVDYRQEKWFIDDAQLDPNATYRVAANDYLATGRQGSLEFFTGNPADVDCANKPDCPQNHGDIRQAVIEELKSRYGGQ